MHKLRRPHLLYAPTTTSLIITKILHFLDPPKVPENWNEYEGKVIFVSPRKLYKNATVLTPMGLGEIQQVFKDYKDRPEWIIVMLYRGYQKQFRYQDLFQLMVYHTPNKNKPFIGEAVLLTPAHYRYIYTNHQPIKYRVSNRRYAILTDETKDRYEYVKTLNKFRYGKRMLDLIRKKKYVISKYTELL